MLHIIDILDNELDNLIDFGNELIASLNYVGLTQTDADIIYNSIAECALLIIEKEEWLDELTWRQNLPVAA